MLTGAILAGGQNRRMEGKQKALLPFSGELLIERQIRMLCGLCEEIIVVTNQPTLYLPVVDRSIRIITDYYPGKGPLSGMHAALALSRNQDVWIVGCDMPFISADAALAMRELKAAAKCDAVIPVINGRSHPLHGIYSKGCADAISALLLSGESRVSELMRMIYWQEAAEAHFEEKHIGLEFVTNVNTPEEYQAALEQADKTALSQ